MKTILSISLIGILFFSTSSVLAIPIVIILNPPRTCTYTPGYNPPQVAYPDVPTDADTLPPYFD